MISRLPISLIIILTSLSAQIHGMYPHLTNNVLKRVHDDARGYHEANIQLQKDLPVLNNIKERIKARKMRGENSENAQSSYDNKSEKALIQQLIQNKKAEQPTLPHHELLNHHVLIFKTSNDISSACFSPDEHYRAEYEINEVKLELAATKATLNSIKLFHNESNTCINIFKGHTNWIESLCFSSNGRWLISGSADKTIQLFDITAGTHAIQTFVGHEHWVVSVCFSPDDKFIASASLDDTIKIWDVATSQCIKTLQHDSVNQVNYSVDGKYLISNSRYEHIKHWNLETGECLSYQK